VTAAVVTRKLTAKEAAAPHREMSDILSSIILFILKKRVARLAASWMAPNNARKTAKGMLRLM
jgi:hypothetical protein